MLGKVIDFLTFKSRREPPDSKLSMAERMAIAFERRDFEAGLRVLEEHTRNVHEWAAQSAKDLVAHTIDIHCIRASPEQREALQKLKKSVEGLLI